MQQEILINTDSLSMLYGADPALREVSLEIRAGGFYGILGPNGSGKTTLINALCGVLKPSSGKISWKGRDLNSYSRRDIARSFAVVPQDYFINFPFTVLEVVMMGRKPHLGRFGRPAARDLEIVYNCMEDCGILSFAEKPITSLSGGERQRVILARALAQDPDVLFLDEATSNMDICHKIELLKLVKKMNLERGVTVIAALHDLNLAGMFCGDLVYMERGEVVCKGPSETVFNEEVIGRVFKVKVLIKKYETNGRYHLSLLHELA